MTYKEFIDNILNTRGRFGCGDEYHERHHIIPKCFGGSNKKDNLIDLYAKEHFIAHKLLAEENPNNYSFVHAYSAMAFMKNDFEKRYELSPEEYEEAKIALSNCLKEKYKDKNNHPSYGTHLSEERKRLIGDINRGNKYCLGRILSDETKRKIGDANRNKGDETRRKMSEVRKGKHMGGDNSNAKKVICLTDMKIYDCAKHAADENNINYSTFKYNITKNKNSNFMYYEDWLKRENMKE